MDIRRCKLIEINQGLHAWTTLEEAQRRLCSGEVIMRAVIPKGTRYFVGNRSDLAAEAMILKKIIYRKKRWQTSCN